MLTGTCTSVVLSADDVAAEVLAIETRNTDKFRNEKENRTHETDDDCHGKANILILLRTVICSKAASKCVEFAVHDDESAPEKNSFQLKKLFYVYIWCK
jgi:hypothetical protein